MIRNINNLYMNRLLISEKQPEALPESTLFVPFTQANVMLPALRSEHFVVCQIEFYTPVTKAQMKFLMHISRLLTPEADILLRGEQNLIKPIQNVLKTIGFHAQEEEETQIKMGKKNLNMKVEESKPVKGLSIGFQKHPTQKEQEEIDEDELLKNEKIDLSKKTEKTSCADKPRACANCDCGRKKNEPLPSKQEIVQSVNEGKPVSGCGKCYLGDSFRCATCPYAGMPAFKPGDRLKLIDENNVVVEEGSTVVTAGKVKIEL